MTQNQHPERLRHIVAIEPDSGRSVSLKRALDQQIDADVLVVPSVEQAVRAICRRPPDLVLISAGLSSDDEKSISAYLKGRTNTSHIQLITLPEFVKRDEAAPVAPAAATGAVVRFRPRGQVTVTPQCDDAAVRGVVAEYLERSEVRRIAEAGRPDGRSYVLPSDRRRAPRKRGSDLHGQWAIRMLAAGDLRILDLSRLGVLFESRSRLVPGIITDLQLLGTEHNLIVPARLVRADVASAADEDIVFHVAAAFSHELDIFVPRPLPVDQPALPPKELGDLLGRVLAGANWVSNGLALCSKFEEELGRLVGVKEVRIGPPLGQAPPECEVVSFKIPGSRNGRLRLHAIFERGRRPGSMHLRLLSAAATLASLVLELAPSARLHSPTI